MNCPYCGTPLVEGARFCGSCGSELPQETPPAGPQARPSGPPPRPGPPPRQTPPPQGAPDIKDPNTALLLELLPGLFMGTFGIGHLYLGRVGRGLLIMFGYWFVLFINAILFMFVIGICTLPLCHLGMLALSAIWAYNDAKAIAEYGQ